MNRNDIISMAREAGIVHPDAAVEPFMLERFANLVAAAEREACAKVCENAISYDEDDPGGTFASAIRERLQPSVGVNGLTEAETSASASMMGLTRKG